MNDLDRFEKVLQEGLLKICRGEGLIGDEMLSSPDIDLRWEYFIKDYVADAVENFNDYPVVALAWAGFLGTAVANQWDTDWEGHKDDPYSSYYGNRGYDDMDEHIVRDMIGMNEQEASKLAGVLASCAEATLGLIRHEGIEPQTATGFFILVRAYSVLFRIGAAIELHRLGYKKTVCS